MEKEKKEKQNKQDEKIFFLKDVKKKLKEKEMQDFEIGKRKLKKNYPIKKAVNR